MSAMTPEVVIQKRQRAFLLQQLATLPEGESLSQSAANTGIPVELELSTAKANELREEMSPRLIHAQKVGKAKHPSYSLTADGKDALRALVRFIPLAVVKGKGKVNPPADDAQQKTREAILLNALRHAPGQTLPKEAIGNFEKPNGHGLNAHTVRAVLSDFALADLITVHRTADSESYSLTTAGEVHLTKIERHIPLAPAKGKVNPPADDAQRQMREAFLLHAIQSAPEHTLSQVEAGKLDKAHGLKLNAATVRAILTDFALAGLITVRRSAEGESYSLTDDGRSRLAAMTEHLPALQPPKKPKKTVPEVVDFPDRDLREAYLLDVLSRATDRTLSQADIDKAYAKKLKDKELEQQVADVVRLRGQSCFTMNAASTRHALEQLVSAGCVETTDENGDRKYIVTAEGLERLKDLRNEFPILPPRGRPVAADDDAMRNMWTVFVLLNVLDAPDSTASEEHVYAVSYPKGSKLNDATAWKLRGELVKSGYLSAEWNGKEGSYTLTPAGLKYLAGLSFDAFDKLSIRGPVLTALLTAARSGGAAAPTPAAPPTSTTDKAKVPTAAELEAAVMDIFHELLRGQYANIRMVPIHEVRAEVRRRYGDAGASREVFNELLLDMRRQKKVWLVSINDRSRVTEQQLNDSIFAVGETFFYLETPHVPASGR